MGTITFNAGAQDYTCIKPPLSLKSLGYLHLTLRSPSFGFPYSLPPSFLVPQYIDHMYFPIDLTLSINHYNRSFNPGFVVTFDWALGCMKWHPLFSGLYTFTYPIASLPFQVWSCGL